MIKEILSSFLILFSVIDIIGSIPIILELKNRSAKKNLKLNPTSITLASGVLLFIYQELGNHILELFGVDVSSFAIAGGIIMFFLGIEMILDIQIFRHNTNLDDNSGVFPLAFPLIAGSGSMTTLISLNAAYSKTSIASAILLNLVFIYLVLHYSHVIGKIMGNAGGVILRKFFGTILLAMAIKLIKTHIKL